MIYFSQLKGKKIKTEDGVLVGVLEDLIFLATDFPKITKLVIRDRLQKKIITDIKYLIKINKEIFIRKNYQLTDLKTNELFVIKNLLDKQIIDLVGNKIVRVNDIAFQDKGGLYITGVDIGLIGILRWLGLANFLIKVYNVFGFKIKPRFLSWADIQPLELARDRVQIKKNEEKLDRLLPEDLADYLEKINIENAKKIIQLMDDKKASEVINDLNLNYQVALFKKIKVEKAARFIEYLDPDEAVDILLTLGLKKRTEIINKLSQKTKNEILYLLKLSTTPVGDLLTTEYLKVKPENTVKEVIDLIKKETGDFSFFTTIYVVNEKKELVGVFSLHELLLQDLGTPVYLFMHQNLVVVHLATPIEIVVKKMLKYDLQILPVIDEKKNILGVITIDDLSDYLLERLKL
ncbi:MAG: CBS domain-containing protein [Patescibacteria group bacterium]|nr:CBS domain-containing protein [Patescibacteria group bacterium]